MFTFAHELAHLWLGADGVSDLDPFRPQVAGRQPIERFCNSVAAEFLIPESELKAQWGDAKNKEQPYHYLARKFKVSPIVAARRALDAGLITRRKFEDFYKEYTQDEQGKHKKRQFLEQPERAGGETFRRSGGARCKRRSAVVSGGLPADRSTGKDV
jgi:Zn-dependent peptidase ImmA (M78 family)